MVVFIDDTVGNQGQQDRLAHLISLSSMMGRLQKHFITNLISNHATFSSTISMYDKNTFLTTVSASQFTTGNQKGYIP